jgi:hypothetical protein
LANPGEFMHGVVVRNVVKLVVQCAVVDVGAWWVFEEVIWRDCVGDHGLQLRL